jgi:hypothetical protein
MGVQERSFGTRNERKRSFAAWSERETINQEGETMNLSRDQVPPHPNPLPRRGEGI